MTAALNPHARFDTLIVGAANRLAVTAAKAVAESPGAVYNPLFVYARPGLGKTHLLMAIGHGAGAINPGLSAEYLTLDNFVEPFHAAIAAGRGAEYRRRFLDVDLLLVDDVQFLAGQRETQAELLRIIDAMQTASRQIVLTSDRPPADIEALDERLIRRFAGGLVIDIAAPDYETRVAILRRKADERRVPFGPGVLEAVARLEIDNVRELVGALNRLIAHQAVRSTPLTPAEARAVLGAAPPEPQADEFGDFLSEVTATVAHQIEGWRANVAAAILRWEGEGYAVGRLRSLLDQELSCDPEAALAAFEADVHRLEAWRAEAEQLAPELAGATALYDPGDMAAAEALLERARAGALAPPAPSAHWRLDELAEAEGNRVALQSARAVVAEPGEKYNPLVIVGGHGVGKTHLLHGIGNALLAAGVRAVSCVGAEEFAGELIEAIGRDAVSVWRARYRRADALLVDDAHLLAGKDRSQDELFLLFNLFAESGRQMVFTSAVPLPRLEGVEARLLTRLEGGLVVELPPPEREIRQHVAERILGEKALAAGPEVAAYLATRPADSVCAFQSLVQRVLSAAEVDGAPLTAEFARALLEGPPARPAPRPAALRASGLVAPGGSVRSREKMVWEWPNPGDRILEEWR
ncbi:MAG TPA: DnaA/Hda family protein [Gemmatimonadales bacterium]|nr:DnaA/Hda family protein [Gemmatimonadales bacterium]